MTTQASNRLVIVTGPSAAGKDTLAHDLLKVVRKLKRVQTCTTRPRKPNDTRYRFLSNKEFETKLKRGDFLEATKVYGLWYGNERAAVERALRSPRVPFMILDPKGAKKVQRIFPTALVVFIRPPSVAALRQRLHARHRDGTAGMQRRLSAATRELALTGWDSVIVNRTGHAKLAAKELIHTVRSYLAAR